MEFWSLVVLGIGALIAIISLTGIDFEFGPFDPLSIGSFCAVFGGTGWVAMKVTNNAWVSFSLAIIVAIIATAIVQLAVIPLRKAEASMASELSEMVGTPAVVILDIPADGLGEILIQTQYGRVNRMAASFERIHIPSNQKVIVVEVKETICYVVKAETLDEEINQL